MSSYIKFMFNYLFQGEVDEALDVSLVSGHGSGASPSPSPSLGPSAGATTNLNAASLDRSAQVSSASTLGAPTSRLLGQNCSVLARLFAQSVTKTAAQSDNLVPIQQQQQQAALQLAPVRGFAELESWLRQQQQQQSAPNSTASLMPSIESNNAISIQTQNSSSGPISQMLWQHPMLVRQSDPALEAQRQSELQECFNQIQLHDYYNSYDIFIGLRIASTLTILFIVFILFVIYKTGCRDNGASSGRKTNRSQLEMVSNGQSSGKQVGLQYRQQQQQRSGSSTRTTTTTTRSSTRPQQFDASYTERQRQAADSASVTASTGEPAQLQAARAPSPQQQPQQPQQQQPVFALA